MDKFLYISASGANQNLMATSVHANNLANAQTTGFRAQLEQARAMPAFGEGLPTRVFNMTENPSNRYEGGPLIPTGRDYDVAVQGDGWFSVLTPQGEEAYTRDGNFFPSTTGVLQDSAGNQVLGVNGPIVLPTPVSGITISSDGVISALLPGAPLNAGIEVDQLKLVNPELNEIKRRADGLFDRVDGQIAEADINVQVQSGMLEGSNVNPIEEMVEMISLQRNYDMQVKMMRRADQLSLRGNQLLRMF
ncbi:MAG: flagellar basal-body rod protein FlgF [Pseudomonadota bacterium]